MLDRTDVVQFVFPHTSAQICTAEPLYYNKHFEVAPHLSPVFTGQGQIGKRLEAAFAPLEYNCPFQRRFVLFGMGGAGKTQICLQYADNYRDRYRSVCSSLTHELQLTNTTGIGVSSGSTQAAMRASRFQ
jgi:hypothetical protein